MVDHSLEAPRIAARFCVKLDRGRTSLQPAACACAASCVCTCDRNPTTRMSLLVCRTLLIACKGWPRAFRSTISSFGPKLLIVDLNARRSEEHTSELQSHSDL